MRNIITDIYLHFRAITFSGIDLYVLLVSRVQRNFVTKHNKSLRLPVFIPISSPFSFPRYLSLPASFLTLYLSRSSILERFKCCGSVTHGDGSYTKRISPVDRTGSGSPTLPLLRSLKLVSSFRPAPFARSFCLHPAVSFGGPRPASGRML